MPTGWNDTDTNALRAHLQHALAEREASAQAADWSYSDSDLRELRAALHGRDRAPAPQREAGHRAG